MHGKKEDSIGVLCVGSQATAWHLILLWRSCPCPSLLHSSELPPIVLAGEIDPDTAIVPADVLSRQALDAQAEDLALEDTLYSLNKALQENVISAEVYMKQVPHLCPMHG